MQHRGLALGTEAEGKREEGRRLQLGLEPLAAGTRQCGPGGGRRVALCSHAPSLLVLSL